MLCCFGWGGFDTIGFIGYTTRGTTITSCQTCGDMNATAGRKSRLSIGSTGIEFYSWRTTDDADTISRDEDGTSRELDGIFEQDQVVGRRSNSSGLNLFQLDQFKSNNSFKIFLVPKATISARLIIRKVKMSETAVNQVQKAILVEILLLLSQVVSKLISQLFKLSCMLTLANRFKHNSPQGYRWNMPKRGKVAYQKLCETLTIIEEPLNDDNLSSIFKSTDQYLIFIFDSFFKTFNSHEM